MSPSKILHAPLLRRPPVKIALVELPDGRVVARTLDELETLPLEDQAAIAEALGVDVPHGGRE